MNVIQDFPSYSVIEEDVHLFCLTQLIVKEYEVAIVFLLVLF